MSLATSAFIASALISICVSLGVVWHYRRWTAGLVATLLSLSTVALLVEMPSLLSVLLAILASFLVLNLFRVVRNRMKSEYLRSVTTTTTVSIGALMLIVSGVWWAVHALRMPADGFWLTALALQLGLAVMLLITTLYHLKVTRPPTLTEAEIQAKLPSLTVAVPARNETDQLARCLDSLIRSDYPKLEILVLDDCSQNQRTPEIIREFAHDGVRFIAGTPSSESWLAKNHAYQQLADEANGEYIVFCGVDARFEPGSLRRLVQVMLHKKKTMMSVMPKNIPEGGYGFKALFVQPMRYAWEIALPRKLFRRPPVLSTCWIIQRKFLESTGSFKAVTRSIVPESYFARMAVVHDGYSFMRSDTKLGITTGKPSGDQHDTAIRTKYPQLHRRPELVLLLAMCEVLLLALPVFFMAGALGSESLTAHGITSGLTTLTLLIWYGVIVWLTYRKILPLGFIILPAAVVYDVSLLIYSMLKYEFSTVLWKGRNVCIPVMRVTPGLPAIDTKPSKARV